MVYDVDDEIYSNGEYRGEIEEKERILKIINNLENKNDMGWTEKIKRELKEEINK